MSMRLSNGAGLLAAALFAISVPAIADLPASLHEHSAGDVRYVTGGVGLRESTAMLGERSRYPLAVEVYANEGGHDVYTAGSDVVVRDGRGDPVLQATADGPFLFADVPAGRYVVAVTQGHRTEVRHVTVHDGGTARAVFVFGAA